MDSYGFNDDMNDYDQVSYENIDELELDNFNEDELGNMFDENMELLNNYDYNLNSPLLRDNLDELDKYMKQNINPRDNGKMVEFQLIRDTLRIMKVDLNSVIGPELIQNVIAKDRLTTEKLEKFYSFGDILCSNVDETKGVLKSFLKGWINKPEYINNFDLKKHWCDLPLLCKVWFEKFISYHNIILILNRTGRYELAELKKRLNIQEVKINGEVSLVHKSNSLGSWLIFRNYVYSKKLNIVLDRNTLLMAKDVMISRFQTLLSMKMSKYEVIYDEVDIAVLMDIYRIGDEVLLNNGNKGYKGIKLLEAICNLKLVESARNARPMIPEFPNFKNHILKSLRELEEEDGLEMYELYTRIMGVQKLDLILTIYGSFRHWGHPFINYLEGLEKLESQVNANLDVDRDYCERLASDLAYKVLKKMFFEKKKWFVDKKLMDKRSKMYEHVMQNTWPTQGVIDDFGDNWHRLPLIKCFDIPDMIDPSIIYSDKSHSINRSEVMKHIREKPNKPIPTRRVLKTLLEKPATIWPEFLKKVNDFGLDWESLVIGLKAKERELKDAGRFFSLMSWELREYFVFTEYLIKEHFVPLFKGLTMADDLQTVIKKMIDVSAGQGTETYENITIANNIDYEKWNNYQRYDSNSAIFTVMGQFLGYPKLIARTHEFFEKSLIYYNQRPDLMRVVGNEVVSMDNKKVAWEGQKGGLEGLRQKGWSVVNLLMIEREVKIRNTLVKVLAQGDNQTITTHYKTETFHNDAELQEHIRHIVNNNNAIMESIVIGTRRLGLKINEDETMQSPDYINYGKVPIVNGVIRGLNTKRWSRVNFVTNDQIPNQTSTLSSVSTNSLTVSHFSNSSIDAMIGHLVFGNFGLIMLDFHNPALRTSPRNLVKQQSLYESREYKILSLYLDPSIGGVGGTSLTRFLIRMFPDPITESLSFWKTVHDNTDDTIIKQLSCAAGNPKLANFKPEDLDKLIESPEGLNIPRGISANNLIKNEVKKNLIMNASQIKNRIIQDAARNCLCEEHKLFTWLRTIKPLFPRFLSQFASSTYYGVTMSLMGLFTNSKTIRSTYRKSYRRELDNIIIKSELISMSNLIGIISRSRSNFSKIWKCSSSQADHLRLLSWGQKVLGMTVPHPLEMYHGINITKELCKFCTEDVEGLANAYITVLCPKGIPDKVSKKGPYNPYLGSKTKESTSILQPWEKESNIPVIKRASDLRKAISWFIKEDSNLAKSIFKNLESLTGEDWSGVIEGYKRTGSALHRFSCSRISSGGYTANAPGKICWTITTTDTMNDLGDNNYDFMYQSSMIYCQMQCLEAVGDTEVSVACHYHIKCKECLREIEEPTLESEWVYDPLDVSETLKQWRPETVQTWSKERRKIQINRKTGNWETLNGAEQSHEIGKTIGFVYADMLLNKKGVIDDKSLFPISIRDKLLPGKFYEGLLMGIKLNTSLQLTHRRNIVILKKPLLALIGAMYYVIERIGEDGAFLSFVSMNEMYAELGIFPHKVPSSYPLNHKDVGLLVRNYLKNILPKVFKLPNPNTSWIFSDIKTPTMIGSMGLSLETVKLISKREGIKSDKVKISELQGLYVAIMNDEEMQNQKTEKLIEEVCKKLCFCSAEIRHAAKFGKIMEQGRKNNPGEGKGVINWGQEYVCKLQSFRIIMDKKSDESVKDVDHHVDYKCNPLISGLRLNQIATGAHYKIRSILKNMNLKYQDFLCGGDGSGGITSCLIRESPTSRGIFNSLLCLDGIPLHGSKPSPPSAVLELGYLSKNCVNLNTVWKEPSDLSWDETWRYFIYTKKENSLRIDLIVMDMEVINMQVYKDILRCLGKYIGSILIEGGCLIFKSYLSCLLKEELSVVDKIGESFDLINMIQTELSSTNTSEVYLLFQGFHNNIKVGLKSNKQKILMDGESLYINRSQEEEFNRAMKFRSEDLGMGIPTCLINNFNVDLSTLLSISGLDGVNTALVTEYASTGEINGMELSAIIMILVSENFINTTKKVNSERVKEHLPSDQSIKKMFGCIAGIGLWRCWMKGDIEEYRFIDNLINFQGVLKIWMNNSGKLSWDIQIDEDTKNKITKRVDIRSKMAYMGQWIRLLCRKYSKGNDRRDEGNVRNVNRILRTCNKNLKLKHIIENTGMGHFL
ncbi:L gene product [Kotonkan virus]|uniref:Replicase n=2 Tax=Kotonkan virus TaxID=318836 RepID=H8XWG0_9RHAB|nr:L gene product [Kotonkan virus]AEI17640.1 L protein [Kotonkan virus]